MDEKNYQVGMSVAIARVSTTKRKYSMNIQSVLMAVISFALVILALSAEIIPQPVVLLFLSLGFVAFIRHFKEQENEFLTHLFK